jgi:hypothetical protein
MDTVFNLMPINFWNVMTYITVQTALLDRHKQEIRKI